MGNTTLFDQHTDYQNWKKEHDPSTILFTGKLGSGKSVLLANIVDDLSIHVQDGNTQVVHFFCRYDVRESLRARTILGSLARQLLSTIPDLTKLSEECDKLGVTSDSEIIRKLILQALPPGHKAFVVLDGIDECESSERNILIPELLELQKELKIFLCVSFRLEANDQTISTFTNLQSVKIIRIPDDNSDIESFISNELQRCIQSNILTINDPNLVFDIQTALLEKSQGMFLWVALQIQTLCTMLSDHDIRKAINNLPKDLSETFFRILKGSQNSVNLSQRLVLEVILAAYRPLTLEELREALSVTPGDTIWNAEKLINDMSSALGCCGCLIIIDEEEYTVRFIHHSVKQFILGEFRDPENVGFSIEKVHLTMADIIVTYLSYGVFGTAISKGNVPPINVQSTPSRVIESTKGSSGVIQKVALKFLANRKKDTDISRTLAELRISAPSYGARDFHLHHYAHYHWTKHIMSQTEPSSTLRNLLPNLIHERASTLDGTGQHCWNLLWWAASNQHSETMALLLQTRKGYFSPDDLDEAGLLYLWAQFTDHQFLSSLLPHDNLSDSGWQEGCKSLLELVSARGNAQMVTLLLQRFPRIGPQDEFYADAIRTGSKSGKVDVVDILLRMAFECDQIMSIKHYNEALHIACREGHEQLVGHIICHCPPDHEHSWEFNKSIICSAIRGHSSIVRILCCHPKTYRLRSITSIEDLMMEKLERKVSSFLETYIHSGNNAVQDRTRKALIESAEEGLIGIIKAVIEDAKEYGGPQGLDDLNLTQALLAASRRGSLDAASLLLEYGAQIDGGNIDEPTPIYEASENGQLEMVKYLLDNGGYREFVHTKWEPICVAAKNGHFAIVKLLTENREYARRVLHKDGLECRNYEIMKLLINRGFEAPNLGDENFLSIVIWAVEMNNLELVSMLVEKGAEWLSPAEGGKSILHFVSTPEIARYFIDKGANVNALDLKGSTPLHVAARLGYVETVQVLLDNGASVEITDKNGMTALSLASVYKRFSVYQKLKQALKR